MSTLVDQLAPHRVGYCFKSVDDGSGYYEHLAASWRAVSKAVPWRGLEPWQWALVPVFSGRVLDRELAQNRFGERFVEVALFGVPTERIAARVAAELALIHRPGTLAVWTNAPRPDASELSFPLDHLITYDTVVLLSRDGPLGRRGFDPLVGMQVVTAADEDDELILNMSLDDIKTLAPQLIRMFGSNLRSWLNEPRRDASPSALLRHARELHWAGAPLLATLVTGTAVESWLSSWWLTQREPELRQQLQDRIDDALRNGLVDKDRVKDLNKEIKKGKPRLQSLIDFAWLAGKVPMDAVDRLHEIRNARNRCAHALEEGADGSEHGPEVEANINWVEPFLAAP